MSVASSYDVVVVGGGPAGLAAATEAATSGLAVALVDERPTLGGQIFKQPGPGFRVADAAALGKDFRRGRALIDAAERSGATVLLRTAVVSIRGTSLVLVEDERESTTVSARHVILAPGAHDRPVAFPGWTLPGVITAGGAQTLVKTQCVLPGKRVVFAGSGPLALAFPAQLVGYGVDVTVVLEAGPSPGRRAVIRLLGAARGNTDLLRDAAGYRLGLLRARVPLRYRRIVVRAEGDGRVEQVVHAAVDAAWRPVVGTEETVAADTLCLGYGFFPSTELLRLAGCAFSYDEDLGGPTVVRDDWLRTSAPSVSAAGDGTGVAGSHVAIDEGRLAALGALLELDAIAPDAAGEQVASDPETASAARGIPTGVASASRSRGGDLRARHAGDDGMPVRGADPGADRGGRLDHGRRERRQDPDPGRDGAVPGSKLPAADRGDDRAPAPARSPRPPRLDTSRAGEARADRGGGRRHDRRHGIVHPR